MSKPIDDGFAMPAEWREHVRCWMAWPARDETWGEHIDAARDVVRDKWMGQHGIRVLRISNREVLADLEFVLVAIEQAARRPPPPSPPAFGLGPLRAPSPQGEGEDDCQPSRVHHV